MFAVNKYKLCKIMRRETSLQLKANAKLKTTFIICFNQFSSILLSILLFQVSRMNFQTIREYRVHCTFNYFLLKNFS